MTTTPKPTKKIEIVHRTRGAGDRPGLVGWEAIRRTPIGLVETITIGLRETPDEVAEIVARMKSAGMVDAQAEVVIVEEVRS